MQDKTVNVYSLKSKVAVSFSGSYSKVRRSNSHKTYYSDTEFCVSPYFSTLILE